MLVAAVVPSSASASELIDRNTSKVTLKVARNGQALLSYSARGKRRNVLAWGAVNALPPTPARRQVTFRLDYRAAGGRTGATSGRRFGTPAHRTTALP